MKSLIRRLQRSNRTASVPAVLQGPPKPCLTEAELAEFKLRHSRVMEAWKSFQMIDEGHRSWLREVGVRYGVGTLFEVDTVTGALNALERSDGPTVTTVSAEEDMRDG